MRKSGSQIYSGLVSYHPKEKKKKQRVNGYEDIGQNNA